MQFSDASTDSCVNSDRQHSTLSQQTLCKSVAGHASCLGLCNEGVAARPAFSSVQNLCRPSSSALQEMVDLNEKRQGPWKQEYPQSQTHPSPHGGMPPTPAPARPPTRGTVRHRRHRWRPAPPIAIYLLCFGVVAAYLGWTFHAFLQPAAPTCDVGV